MRVEKGVVEDQPIGYIPETGKVGQAESCLWILFIVYADLTGMANSEVQFPVGDDTLFGKDQHC